MDTGPGFADGPGAHGQKFGNAEVTHSAPHGGLQMEVNRPPRRRAELGLRGSRQLSAVAGGDRHAVHRERFARHLGPVEAQHVLARLGDELGAERVV
jgi:hypothetical protein